MLWDCISAYWKSGKKPGEKRRTAIGNQYGEAEREWQKSQEHAEREKIVAALHRIGDQTDSANEQQKADSKTRYAWDRYRFWLDVTAVIVAAFGACFLFEQQNDMKGQLDAMVADQRPWIKIDEIPKVTKVEIQENNIIITLKVIFMNVGKSPAFNFFFHMSQQISRLASEYPGRTKYDGREILNKAVSSLESIKDRSGTVIFPNETLPQGGFVVVHRDEISRVKSPPPMPPGPGSAMPGAAERWNAATTGHPIINVFIPCIYQASERADVLWTGYIFQIKRLNASFFDFDLDSAPINPDQMEVIRSDIGVSAQ